MTWTAAGEARAHLAALGLAPFLHRGRVHATCPACDGDRALYLHGLTPRCWSGCEPAAVQHALWMLGRIVEDWARFGRPTVAQLAERRARAVSDLCGSLQAWETRELAARFDPGWGR